jgi:hypothetical protein
MIEPARYCVDCEGPLTCEALCYIGHDGRYGSIAGLVCAHCRKFWNAPGAEPVLIGRFDFEGLDALTWFVRRLHALGCEPRPRG